MCGIFGRLGELPSESRRFVREALFHRGPDDQQFAEIDQWCFFHSRLSILDMVGGKQPWVTDDLIVIFNGEIYNYRELTRRFSLDVSTHCDTEVIEKLFRKLGSNCFQELSGMFAIAIYHRPSRQLLLARDRSGKKPLYYQPGEHFIFASEMKAIFASGAAKQIDQRSVLQIMRYGFVQPGNTVYKDVHELKPGSYMTIDSSGGIVSQQDYWNLDRISSVNHSLSDEQAIEQMDQVLKRAVESRVLASDLEVGAFLSSGVDSSLICSYAREVNPNIQTFTIATGGEFDEATVAQQIAKRLGLKNEVLDVNYDHLERDYASILLAYDEPIVDESIIPTYYVSKAAKERLTVVLTGDGGDEVFGGYRRHVLYRYYRTLELVGKLAQYLPVRKLSGGKLSNGAFLERLSRIASAPLGSKYWIATTDLFFECPSPISEESEYLPNWPSQVNDSLAQGLRQDFLSILPQILLRKVDIATMQHALEARCPFLDSEVVEMGARLPARFKVRGRTTKWILRTLMERRVGKDFSNLPKRGFELSVQAILHGPLNGMLQDLVYAKSPYFAEILDFDTVKRQYLNVSDVDPYRKSKGLLALLNLELWAASVKSDQTRELSRLAT